MENNLQAYEKGTGKPVNKGDRVTDGDGKNWTLVSATRAQSPGKSGKVVVVPFGSDVNDSREMREFYDKVFDLEVWEAK